MSAVTVFCSASFAAVPLYEGVVKDLARGLARQGCEIVYGGSSFGLMGVLADAAMAVGGVVRGVIPQVITDMEAAHPGLTELIDVPDMHQRKKKMLDLGDAVIVLPGGLGTLDEMVEAITWKQLGIHQKEIILLNSGGFWDGFLQHVRMLKANSLLHGQTQLFSTFEKVDEVLARVKELNNDTVF